MISFDEKLTSFYKENKNLINRVPDKENKKEYKYFLKNISEKSITKDFAICPICGYIKSTLVQHMKNKHNINNKKFKKLFPNYRIGSFNYFSKASLARKDYSQLSKRMTINNPMKILKTRIKVSKTKKYKFKNDENFRNMQLNNFIKMCNTIKDNKDCFKIPGWGLSGKYNNKIYFRSKNELKMLIWFKQNNLLDVVESNIPFKLNGKIYFADFKIDNVIYEIKTRRYKGKYIPTKREEQQFLILKHLESIGYKVNIFYNDSDEIKEISMLEILKEYLTGSIIFSKNSSKTPFAKRIIKEAKQYAKCS